MTGQDRWALLRDLEVDLKSAGWPIRTVYAQLWLPGTGEHIHGRVTELETGTWASDRHPCGRITLEDIRGTRHLVDLELVGNVHVYGSGRKYMAREPLGPNPFTATAGEHADRRLARALTATSSRFARPYVHLAADHGWVVHHPLAPVGFRYETLQDAYRVAAGCVA